MDLSISSNRKIFVAQICKLITMGDAESAADMLKDYLDYWRSV